MLLLFKFANLFFFNRWQIFPVFKKEVNNLFPPLKPLLQGSNAVPKTPIAKLKFF